MLGIYPRRGIEIVKHEKHVLTYKYTDIFKNAIDCILDFALKFNILKTKMFSSLPSYIIEPLFVEPVLRSYLRRWHPPRRQLKTKLVSPLITDDRCHLQSKRFRRYRSSWSIYFCGVLLYFWFFNFFFFFLWWFYIVLYKLFTHVSLDISSKINIRRYMFNGRHYKHFLANITIIEVQNCFGLVVPEDFPIYW